MKYAVVVAGALALLALSPAVQAQTWGQPVYLNAGGRAVGGSALSEVETRSYAETGRWADGYSERPYVYVPGPGYDHGEQYARYTSHYHDRSYGRRHRPDSRVGYRDEWGYQDDRPPSTANRRQDRHTDRRRGDCGCGDAYLYDR